MGNTYTQLHIQLVFAVKYRAAFIHESWEIGLHKYITGIVQQNKHKLLQINGMMDHIHILAGIRPDQSISSLVQNIKSESSKWVRDNKLCRSQFAWQEGFGAFSYSKKDIHNVVSYIQNQKQHHREEPFLAEYKKLLKEFEIEFNDKYLFVDPI